MSAEDGAEGIEAVRRWIRETGYPLEYAAARTLQSVGFTTYQGMHYRTSTGEAAKAREIDVVADPPFDQVGPRSLNDYVSVRMVVECKVLRFPWVVLTREVVLKAEHVLRRAIGSDRATEVLVEVIGKASTTPDLFIVPRRHGFNVVEARIQTAAERRNEERKREDERVDGAYAALAQVTSAAVGLMKQSKAGLGLYWPVIVVRGPLFQLGYDEEGTEILESVEWQRVRWAGQPDGVRMVDVVRERYLLAYGRMASAGLSDAGERLAAISGPKPS